MLDFEEEMKAVKAGYVVMSLDEYNKLRDEIATANMQAYEIEQLANRRIADAAANNQAIIDSLFRIEQRNYGTHDIDICFDTRAIRAVALNMLGKYFSAEELEKYDIKPAEEMHILDELLATRKPEIVTAADVMSGRKFTDTATKD